MFRHLAIALLTAHSAWACLCSSHPTMREAWRNSTLVFVGKIEKQNTSLYNWRYGIKEYTVRVIEPFKGVRCGQGIVFRQANSFCRTNLKPGETVLFELVESNSPGVWVVPVCTSRTSLLDHATGDLRFLRALPASASGTRLAGSVQFKRLTSEAQPVPRWPVTIKPVKGGRPVSVKTDSNGVYEVYGLSAGNYSVSIQTPAGQALKSAHINGGGLRQSNTNQFLLPSDTEIIVDFTLGDDTEISGRLTLPSGNPPEVATIQLEPLESAPAPNRFLIQNPKHGFFQFKWIPPGRYRLQANREFAIRPKGQSHKTYYPGTPDSTKATVLTITPGSHLTNINIRLLN